LRVEDLRIENSPAWTMSIINCDDVRIQGVSIRNPIYGRNTDGLDMDGCQNVLISNCTIETGDDAICFKSEDPTGEGPRLARNISVTNCILTTCCNAFKIGTGTFGGFENITFSNSTIYSNPGPFENRVISGIALEVVDGGWVEGVFVSGIRMQRTRTPIFIRLGRRSRQPASGTSRLGGVCIDGVHATDSILASSITGIPDLAVEDVSLSNIRVESALPSRQEWVGRGVPEVEGGYPEARMFGMLPVSGLYARHVRDIRLANVSFKATKREARPTIHFDQVSGARISGLSSSAIVGSEPVVRMHDTHDAWITASAAPAATEAFLEVGGAASEGIMVSNCDLCRAVEGIRVSDGATKSAVTSAGNLQDRTF
jgi:hypothetical protein